MACFGDGNIWHVSGIVHDESGFPATGNPRCISDLVGALYRKLENHLDEIEKYEWIGAGKCDGLIVITGIAARSAKNAIEQLRAQGINVAQFWPINRDVNTIKFDSMEGEPVQAITGKYEAEVVLLLPVRMGYVFTGWYPNAECKEDERIGMSGDTVTIGTAAETTYYAGWSAEEVGYTVVYMIEKENLDHDPDINNPADFYASDIVITDRTAIVGEEVTASEEDLAYGFTAGMLYKDDYVPNLVITDCIGADTAVVAGDGSTVVNVYFARRKLNLIFDLSESLNLNSEQAVQMWVRFKNSDQYLQHYQISNVKYGEDITSRWPSDYTCSFYSRNDAGEYIPARFTGWNYPGARWLILSHRYKVEGLALSYASVSRIRTDIIMLQPSRAKLPRT